VKIWSARTSPSDRERVRESQDNVCDSENDLSDFSVSRRRHHHPCTASSSLFKLSKFSGEGWSKCVGVFEGGGVFV
jgi:hypothetical protein